MSKEADRSLLEEDKSAAVQTASVMSVGLSLSAMSYQIKLCQAGSALSGQLGQDGRQ